MEAVLDACAVFENLRRKLLRDGYRSSVVGQGEDREERDGIRTLSTVFSSRRWGLGGDNNSISGRSCTY
jgi:hypothetical protein